MNKNLSRPDLQRRFDNLVSELDKEYNIKEDIIQNSTVFNYNSQPRRLSQDLRRPTKKFFFMWKSQSSDPTIAAKSKELQEKVYNKLDKDVATDLVKSPELQEKLNKLMEELDIDFALNTEENNNYVLTDTYIKKRSRRMSAQMREYKATKYRSNWQHRGVVKI